MADKLTPQRKLASVQRIISIDPIEGADNLELATVLGWHVVVLKSENYNVGDLIIYCEVDSLLPLKPQFEFLAKGSAPKKMYVDGQEVQGYRIKTIRLRGQVSQGIVFPLSILSVKQATSESPEFTPITDEQDKLDSLSAALPEGFDLTKVMGIHKYEMPLPSDLAGVARGGFPGYLRKTDETRLQAMPALLERYKDVLFYVTEKIDGSSVTYSIKDDEFHAIGRGIDWMDDGKNTIWRVAKEMELEQRMRELGVANKVALQGEIFGPGIQGNPLKQSKVAVRFFNAYDFTKDEYLNLKDFKFLIHLLGAETVPIIDERFTLLPTVDEMVAYASRPSVINPHVKLEGIVLRPETESRDPDLGRLSFKVISPEYLLKHDS